MKVHEDHEEHQSRERNRGKWHVCEYCEEEYEGDPVSSTFRDFCSEECLVAQQREDDYWVDYSAMELELWERENQDEL